MKSVENKNYCANIVEIKNIINLDNCDNVCHANILSNLVIVSKDVKIGDIGIFFPIETKLSNDFLKNNNLYRKPELNIDNTKKGYFEENGRIRCVKFRGNASMGFFVPLTTLNYLKTKETFVIGDEFDTIDGNKICEKYVIINKNLPSTRKLGKIYKKSSKVIENQFRFHLSTDNLYKNIHKLNPDDLISLSIKLHGSSFIVSNLLCKRKLNIIEKIFIKIREWCE